MAQNPAKGGISIDIYFIYAIINTNSPLNQSNMKNKTRIQLIASILAAQSVPASILPKQEKKPLAVQYTQTKSSGYAPSTVNTFIGGSMIGNYRCPGSHRNTTELWHS